MVGKWVVPSKEDGAVLFVGGPYWTKLGELRDKEELVKELGLLGIYI